jgi:nucleoid-associated protein YgaU
LKAYGTGYSWNKIYEANKELIGKNPSVLSTGVKLVLPASEVATTEYTVVRGDNLWNISVKMCGTGFAWESIAAVNNLPNPRIIQPGIVLKVQCK